MNSKLDGLITTEQGYPYCLIYIKTNLHGLLSSFAKIKAWDYINKIQARFAIITDGESYFFFDKLEAEAGFLTKEYSKIINKLLDSDLNIESKKHLIYEYFCENFHAKKIELNPQDVRFDGNKYSIVPNKEDQLIEDLFKFESPSQFVYRYLSLNTLFDMLKQKKIYMSGIAGMNDKSEVDYVEKILYEDNNVLPLDPEINKLFIISCSEKEDDLTQWRLYGDDGKGVCLKFELKKKVDADFICRKIKYLNKDAKQISKLKDLVRYVYDHTGHTFVFETFHEWCHFIKSEDWKVESEVRLLYRLRVIDPNSQPYVQPPVWLIANGTNIVNPYMNFNIDKFPLKLIDIKLGPKCPEPKMNEFQLKAFMENKAELKDIEVSKSKIENYR